MSCVAVPGSELFVVRLESSLEVNHARIRVREATPESMQWHLDRATQLHEELSTQKLEHVLIPTEGKSVREIAAEIVESWLLLHKVYPKQQKMAPGLTKDQ